MKSSQILISLLMIAQCISAQQTGSIAYNETIKLKINAADIPGVDISSMLPESTTFSKALYFNAEAMMYKEGKGDAPEDTEITSDDGSFQMVFSNDDGIEEILYTDMKNKLVIHQQGFLGKSFVIEKEVPKIKWRMTGEKVKYLEYECMKATTTYDDKSIVAWFAPQLPSNIGPAEFGQLPGAILMLSVDDGKKEYMATSVDLEDSSENIKAPKDGKKVTQEEYDQIVEEKMKEMEERHGNGTVIIRG